MKNALKKIILTDTDKPELEHNIPSWKDDREFKRWKLKAKEISQQLMEAEAQERYIHEELRQTEDEVTRLKSEILLGEGDQAELERAESSVSKLLQRNISNVKEIKALKMAKSKAESETAKAERDAREKCQAVVLPIYQAEVGNTRDLLQAAEAQNQRVKEFEELASKRGLTLNRGSFGSPYVIRNLAFPLGLKEFSKSVEGLLNKKTL